MANLPPPPLKEIPILKFIRFSPSRMYSYKKIISMHCYISYDVDIEILGYA